MKPEKQKTNHAVENEENLQDKKVDFRYVYFGRNTKNNQHSGVTCVGYLVNEKGNAMLLGAAFCSPADIFSKKKARAIIVGRILKGLQKTEEENESVDLGYEVLEAKDTLFSDMSYEGITQVIREALNERVTDLTTDELKRLAPEDRTRFASVCIPYWFEGV